MYEQFIFAALTNAFLGTMLAISAWGIYRLTKNSQMASILWIAVFLKFITPPFVELPLLPVSQTVTQVETTVTNQAETNIQAESSTGINIDAEISNNSGLYESLISERDSEESELVGDITINQNEIINEQLDSVEIDTPEFAAIPVIHKKSDLKIPDIKFSISGLFTPFNIFVVWISGSLITFFVMIWRGRKFENLIKKMKGEDHSLQQLADQIAQKMGMKHAPVVRVLDASITPMIWAFGLKPLILIPAQLYSEASQEKQSMILAHELAHIKRKDHLFRWVELAVLVLFWWFPVIRWIRKEWHTIQEECCDAWVIRLFPKNRVDYGEVLLEAAAFLQQKPAPVWASELGTKNSLKERIEIMLERKNVTPLTRSMKYSMLLILGPLLALSIGQVQKKPNDEVDKEASKPEISVVNPVENSPETVIEKSQEPITESDGNSQTEESETEKQKSKRLAKYLIDGWLAERKKIRKGQFKIIHEVELGRSAESITTSRMTDQCLITFDSDKDIIALVEKQIHLSHNEKSRRGKELKHFLMKRPDDYYRWSTSSDIFSILRPSYRQPPVFQVGENKSLTDINLLISYEVPPDHIRIFHSSSLAKSLGKGRYVLVHNKKSINKGSSNVTKTDMLIINENKGFSIERRLISFVKNHVKQTPHDIINIKWKQVNNTWVPVDVKYVNLIDQISGRISYKWNSVNKILRKEFYEKPASVTPSNVDFEIITTKSGGKVQTSGVVMKDMLFKKGIGHQFYENLASNKDVGKIFVDGREYRVRTSLPRYFNTANSQVDKFSNDPLVENLQHKDKKIRDEFTSKLKKHLRQSPETKVTDKILENLLKVLNHEKPEIRLLAADILGEYISNKKITNTTFRTRSKIHRDILDAMIVKMNQDSEPMMKYVVASHLKVIELRACSRKMLDVFYHSEGIDQYYSLGLMQSMLAPWDLVRNELISASRRNDKEGENYWNKLAMKLVTLASKKKITDKEYQAAFQFCANGSKNGLVNIKNDNERVNYFRQEITEIMILALALPSRDLTEGLLAIAEEANEDQLKVIKHILQLGLGVNKFGRRLIVTDEMIDQAISMINSENKGAREISSIILKYKINNK